MGPKQAKSTVLTKEEEAIIVAFRKHTLFLWMIVFMRYKQQYYVSQGLVCIVACKDITLVDYQMSMVKLKQYPITPVADYEKKKELGK